MFFYSPLFPMPIRCCFVFAATRLVCCCLSRFYAFNLFGIVSSFAEQTLLSHHKIVFAYRYLIFVLFFLYCYYVFFIWETTDFYFVAFAVVIVIAMPAFARTTVCSRRQISCLSHFYILRLFLLFFCLHFALKKHGCSLNI